MSKYDFIYLIDFFFSSSTDLQDIPEESESTTDRDREVSHC